MEPPDHLDPETLHEKAKDTRHLRLKLQREHEGHLMQHKTDGMLIIETEGGILFRTSTPFATQTSRYALEHRETTYPGGVGFEKLHITAPFAPHLVQSLCTFWISRSLKVSVDRILDFAIPSPQLEAYIRPTTNYLCSLLDLIRIGHWADDTAFISSVHAGLRYYLIKGKHTLAELILSLEKIYVGEHKDEECFHTARSILLTRLLKDQNAIMDNGPLHTKLKHLTSLSKELNDNLSLGTTYWHECWRPDEKPASLQDSQMYLYMRPTLGRQVVYILDFQMQKTAPINIEIAYTSTEGDLVLSLFADKRISRFMKFDRSSEMGNECESE